MINGAGQGFKEIHGDNEDRDSGISGRIHSHDSRDGYCTNALNRTLGNREF